MAEPTVKRSGIHWHGQINEEDGIHQESQLGTTKDKNLLLKFSIKMVAIYLKHKLQRLGLGFLFF